jgi:soluble lytic murein transglycosylase-like protein
MSMPAVPPDEDRRHTQDRRAERSANRRAAPRPPWVRWAIIGGRDLVIALSAVAAIIVAQRRMHPIYANQPTIVQRLSRVAPNLTRTIVGPTTTDTDRVAQMMASPQFKKDREAFAASLVNTGRMSQARADSISYYAVRESYIQGIPPAVVFGVMLTENAQFESKAKSNVGAVGLMQVYPKVWLKELSGKFGKDLANDSTNLKYGIYILRKYIKSDSGSVTPGAISSGLLHYNGCVTGKNTPNCKTYPGKVKNYVESIGGSLCEGKTFYDCIAKPFVAGLFGRGQAQGAQTQ